MSESLTNTGNAMPATTDEWMQKVYSAESNVRAMPQIKVCTEHILHGGMYSRTVRLAADVIIVGVLVKCPTMLVIRGCAIVFAGDKWQKLDGYNVIPAMAGRKQIYITASPTEITMLFPTKATSVEEAEKEFTDETENLISRKYADDDIVVITGVPPCQV